MDKLIDIDAYPIRETLKILLQDKTTSQNIIWATDAYAEKGIGFQDRDHIELSSVNGLNSIALQSRTEKAWDEQQLRTRKKAEVFTPVWLCNMMNNYADEQWFGRKNVFNTEDAENHTWTVNSNKILFSERTWKSYVDTRRMEITCGEAPYLVSRYDAATGELILPPLRRIGLLDRKLRIVNENADSPEEWIKWTLRAYQSCYGFEYQGDNLLIARINLMMTFYDYYLERMEKEPEKPLLRKVAGIIAWNVWQMDGLKDTVPLGKQRDTYHQMDLFELVAANDKTDAVLLEPEEAVYCKIMNWRRENSIMYRNLKGERSKMGKGKLFDYVIGNPPYQESYKGDSTGANSVYDKFMEASYKVSNKTELITPARFLFNAGSTPKGWNEKMLTDEHLKIMKYERDASVVFPNTDIKGGVAITYHDDTQKYGIIGVFTPYEQLNSILKKVREYKTFRSLSETGVTSSAYHFTDDVHIDYPEFRKRKIVVKGKTQPLLSKGHEYDLKSSIFEKLPEIFKDAKPDDGEEYIQILGRDESGRSKKYIKRRYINTAKNLNVYKIFLPKASGSGQLGEILTMPIIGGPLVGATETFYSLGLCKNEEEIENMLAYIKTKFARVLLSVLKITQDVNPGKWKYVPLQDFTSKSDINWGGANPRHRFAAVS